MQISSSTPGASVADLQKLLNAAPADQAQPDGQETTATTADPANVAGPAPAPSTSADQFSADTLAVLLTAQESSTDASQQSQASQDADGASAASKAHHAGKGHHHHHTHAASEPSDPSDPSDPFSTKDDGPAQASAA